MLHHQAAILQIDVLPDLARDVAGGRPVQGADLGILVTDRVRE